MTIKITKNAKGYILIDFKWKSCFAYEHERVIITEYPIGKVYATVAKKLIEVFKRLKAQKRMDF